VRREETGGTGRGRGGTLSRHRPLGRSDNGGVGGIFIFVRRSCVEDLKGEEWGVIVDSFENWASGRRSKKNQR